MKKTISIALIALIAIAILGLTVHGFQNNLVKSSPKNILIPNLNKNKSEVFKDLKLEEGKDIEQNKQHPYMYDYKEKQKFGGDYFTQSLLFDNNSNTLYGIMYLNQYKQNPEGGYKEAIKLNKELNKRFGKPTTYPSQSDRIEKMPSYNDLIKSKERQQYFETWKVNDDVMVELNMNYNADYGTVVSVQYKLTPPILKNNKQ